MNLDLLPSDDSACAIRSVFDAYRFTGTQEVREVWVSRLAELSQGWSQHINSVAVAACDIILNNGRRIDSSYLDEAMAAAEEYKNEYYAGRLAAGTDRSWVYKVLALAAEENGGKLTYDGIESLTEEVRRKAGESMEDFLTKALHAGLLAPTQEIHDHYRIPIPSFGDYLRALPVDLPSQI